jgi:phosphatidylserine decarboxylase
MTGQTVHQYVDRRTSEVRDEKLSADRLIRALYSEGKERSPFLFNLLTSRRASQLLGILNFDRPCISVKRMARNLGIDLSECVDRLEDVKDPRRLFERKVRYWQCRPMANDDDVVVSPSDARLLLGSLAEHSLLFIKEKFFHVDELIGFTKTAWQTAFREGSFAVLRLTPDKYHYNHLPVAGKVVDFYEVQGRYHSCNPAAAVEVVQPYSKNKRVVTVIDTDLQGGTRVGLVAMIEVVALMIGDIRQCYSEHRYERPEPVRVGMLLKKGQPKSLFRPGSSVVVLMFQKERVDFSADLVRNMSRAAVRSRFSAGFGKPLVETDVRVRSEIARRSFTDER